MNDALRRTARAQLENYGIEVVNNARAQEVTADKVILDNGEEVEAENVIWCAGNRASVKIEELDLPLHGEDGIEVDRYFRVPGKENVWAVGDCAAVLGENEEQIPPNAQAAVQEGQALAKNILTVIDGKEEKLSPFKHEEMGHLVELGSQFAVNEVMGIRFSGLFAALFRRATYLFKLEIPENRARIATEWALNLFFHPSVTQVRGREGA
jgi:NADH dehydrogenase